MTGSCLFNYELYYNGLMTDWGLCKGNKKKLILSLLSLIISHKLKKIVFCGGKYAKKRTNKSYLCTFCFEITRLQACATQPLPIS